MNVKIFSILLAVVSTCTAITFDKVVPQNAWEKFKKTNNKKYVTPEAEEIAYKIFYENTVMVNDHNAKFKREEVSYNMAINEFSDMSFDEIIKLMGGVIPEKEIKPEEISDVTSTPEVRQILPPTLDYRTSGFLSPVKNQRFCGSCWAFAALVPMEYQVARQVNAIQDYSEQQLVDCVYTRNGCWGGWMSHAYDYIIRNRGIKNEPEYLYTAVYNRCRARSPYAATCGGYTNVLGETDLYIAVANRGPVAVAICVNNNFVHYRSGVFDDPNCCRRVNHAVAVIGYGYMYRREYWLVQNSWGTRWGDRGYIKMSKNKCNQCEIASYGIIPIKCYKL